MHEKVEVWALQPAQWLNTLRPLIKWREESGAVERNEKIRTAEESEASSGCEGASELFSGTEPDLAILSSDDDFWLLLITQK
ncbi:MAG: hypothetical protein ACQETE_16415 [Bacteroidota bacterium]